MKYIILIIGLLVVGCLKKEQTNQKQIVTKKANEAAEPLPEKPIKGLTLEEKVVGTYELKDGKLLLKLVFLDDGLCEAYKNGKKLEEEGKWSISKEGELRFIDEHEDIGVFRINKDGSLTLIAEIDKSGRRIDRAKDQLTYKRIK